MTFYLRRANSDWHFCWGPHESTSIGMSVGFVHSSSYATFWCEFPIGRVWRELASLDQKIRSGNNVSDCRTSRCESSDRILGPLWAQTMEVMKPFSVFQVRWRHRWDKTWVLTRNPSFDYERLVPDWSTETVCDANRTSPEKPTLTPSCRSEYHNAGARSQRTSKRNVKRNDPHFLCISDVRVE